MLSARKNFSLSVALFLLASFGVVATAGANGFPLTPTPSPATVGQPVSLSGICTLPGAPPALRADGDASSNTASARLLTDELFAARAYLNGSQVATLRFGSPTPSGDSYLYTVTGSFTPTTEGSFPLELRCETNSDRVFEFPAGTLQVQGEGTTTTVVAPTTTVAPATTTSTSAPVTTRPTSSTTADATVAAEVESANEVAASGGELAATGRTTLPFGAVGLALLAGGLLLCVSARRRLTGQASSIRR